MTDTVLEIEPGVPAGDGPERRDGQKPRFGIYHAVLRCCGRRIGYSHLPRPLGEPPEIACKACGKPMKVTKFDLLREMSAEDVEHFRSLYGSRRGTAGG